jgi:hypothetical protein
MFHHGLEGQISRYAGALRYAELLPLKEAGVDYLASATSTRITALRAGCLTRFSRGQQRR